MQQIVRLEGAVKSYDWGSHTILATLQGKPGPSSEPEAELWLGAHANGSALAVLPDGTRVALGELVERDPRGVLGDAVFARFGARFPFLLKVLAVARALSLQAHPDAEQARAGYQREQGGSVAREARLYADDRAKPELVLAHTRFHALCGFRPLAEIRAGFERMGLADVAPPAGAAEGEWLRGFFARWFAPDAIASRATRLDRALDAAARASASDEAAVLMLRLAAQHPGDPGILAPLLLHSIELSPGEAIFLEAGELHCYLEGAAAEIMSSSDNVLRAGLTTKRRAADELLRIGRFASRRPQVLRGATRAPGVCIYATSAEEFELGSVEVGGEGVVMAGERSVEVLLCYEGAAQIAPLAGGDALALASGQSCLVPAAVGAYRIVGHGRLYRASVPSGTRSGSV
ncbi:MAG: mannose-6-phosphate isomerase, class [Deltaproteobacteria bacterium]|nr:mannose-6-phosphate isomerase, class [Deltaproteobacteria bacterium]